MALDPNDRMARQRLQCCPQVKGRSADGGYIRCGREFWGYSSYQRCPDCADERQRENEADRRKRRLAKQAKQRREARLELRCAVCGGSIHSAARARSEAAYCSPSCRQKAYRQRAADKLATLVGENAELRARLTTR